MDARERVEELAKTAKAIEPRVNYPIRDFRQLADALGGEEADIEFEGRKRKVGSVRRLVPPEYFPIDSTEDLIAKAAELRSRADPGWPGDVERGNELNEVPSHAGRPSFPEDEIAGRGARHKIKGWRQRDASAT
jgi:hypothetical protein